MEHVAFSIELVDQRKVKPLGLVKKCICESGWNPILICFCGDGFTLTQLFIFNFSWKTLVKGGYYYA